MGCSEPFVWVGLNQETGFVKDAPSGYVGVRECIDVRCGWIEAFEPIHDSMLQGWFEDLREF